MAKNKVVFGNTTIIDLTDSTVTPDTLALGVVAYDRSGERIVGTMAGMPDTEQDGYWKYRIYDDGTFEAWYLRTGMTFDIKYASGNFYRSDPVTINLPAALENVTVENVQAQVFHANYPVFGAISTISPIKVQALSGAQRSANANHTVVIYAFGTVS